MSERLTKILQLLIQEYSASGHEVTEHMGQQFARITYKDGDTIQMTDINLTRLAKTIETGLERKQL